jgi:hypothetical protein
MLTISRAQMNTLRAALGRTTTLCPDHHWIEIELVDSTCHPVPDELYEVTLPNGTRQAGALNANGWARVDFKGASGDCLVRFPRIHWKELKTAPESPLPPLSDI